jgi:hypothetical protein
VLPPQLFELGRRSIKINTNSRQFCIQGKVAAISFNDRWAGQQ